MILPQLHTQYWLRSECLLRRYTFPTQICTTWKVHFIEFIQRRGAGVGNPWSMYKRTPICKLFDIIPIMGTAHDNNETNLQCVKLKKTGVIVKSIFVQKVNKHAAGKSIIRCKRRRTVNMLELGKVLTCLYGSLIRYVKLRVAHAPGMPGTFSLPPRISNPDIHHGTYVTHVPWCMPGLLTSSFLWNRWRGKCSRHSRRMHNPQFHLCVKRPIVGIVKLQTS